MATLVLDAGVCLPYMYTVHTDLPTFALAHTCGQVRRIGWWRGNLVLEQAGRAGNIWTSHRDPTFDCKSLSCWLWSWEAFCWDGARPNSEQASLITKHSLLFLPLGSTCCATNCTHCVVRVRIVACQHLHLCDGSSVG